MDAVGLAAAFACAAVESETRHADALLQAYGIQGVPTPVVDGRFLTGPGLVRETAAGFPGTPAALDRLVARVESERGGRGAGRARPVGPRSGS